MKKQDDKCRLKFGTEIVKYIRENQWKPEAFFMPYLLARVSRRYPADTGFHHYCLSPLSARQTFYKSSAKIVKLQWLEHR